MTGPQKPPLFDRLEVLDDPRPHDGAFNMALDEILLLGLAATPLLRIYRWSEPAVSFGYFEPWEPVALRYPAHKPVRRWTGGGVVRHGHDVTYSLLVPRSHPLTNLPAGESYRLIHEALVDALDTPGVSLVASAQPGHETPQTGSRVCFDTAVRYDVMSGGRKISGAAQRRTRHGLLHQGSIQGEGWSHLGPELLVRGLPPVLSRRDEPRVLTAVEMAAASALCVAKYATHGWLKRV